jgi:hypothetical protein
MAVFENWALKTWLLPTPHEAPWRVRSYSRLIFDEDLETDFGVIRVILKISQVLKSSLEKKLEWSDFPESFNSTSKFCVFMVTLRIWTLSRRFRTHRARATVAEARQIGSSAGVATGGVSLTPGPFFSKKKMDDFGGCRQCEHIQLNTWNPQETNACSHHYGSEEFLHNISGLNWENHHGHL